ncbi:hypothetical protein [Nonomuraea sp. NPDC050783]|uniref:hypothetical protein n=1 Tax=Nonomuraea sp. NPDC050783 TaxID=3154634 RepID=UPI0034668276
MATGDELVRRILDDETSSRARSRATSYLLRELGRGYPVERLAPLLMSDDPEVVQSGAWLVSEMGGKGVVLRGLITRLLDHAADRVRFHALDSLLCWATPADGVAIATAISKVIDTSSAVRWKALRFLAALGRSELEAGAASLQGRLKELTLWLAGHEMDAFDRSEILTRLDASEPLVRSFAVAAAARMSWQDPSLLAHAKQSTDDDIREFARTELEG